MSLEKYYIVSVRCHEVLASDGTVMMRDDELVWISEEDNFPSHTRDKKNAHRFEIRPTKKYFERSSGYPWWFKHKPGTMKLYTVTEIHTSFENEIPLMNH